MISDVPSDGFAQLERSSGDCGWILLQHPMVSGLLGVLARRGGMDDRMMQ
jgi:hypothetical protein